MGMAVYDKGFAEGMESDTGYTMFTTFWDDFAIAERMGIGVQNGCYVPVNIKRGIAAIQDTYNRAFKEWRSDYKYLTEFVMVLNWKANRFSSMSEVANIPEYCELYTELYYKADNWATSNLKGEEYEYYYKTTN